MIHHHKVVRQKFRLREAVAGDPGLVVGMALLVTPEFLVRVRVVGNVTFRQLHALVADVDGDLVGNERERVHGTQGAEADVDDVALVRDGDNVDHVVPALADGARQRQGLASVLRQKQQESHHVLEAGRP